MFAPILLIFCFVPSILSQCTVETAEPFFKRSIYEFSLDLITRVAEETENHFVTSPFSIWTLISTLSLAADGVTKDEIKEVLRQHPHKCFNKKFFEIVEKIKSSTDGTLLERSSTLFIDEEANVRDEFLATIKKTGVTEAKVLNFNNNDVTASTINEYVSNATHGTVEEIISPNDLDSVNLILIDAIFFKGLWSIPFPESDTETSAFYDEKNQQIGDVNLMFVGGEFSFVAMKQIEAKILELPYGTQDRFSLLVFLPFDGVPLTKVMYSLKTISLKSIVSLLASEESGPVFVQIPRFKITSDLDNLKELLSDMGLRSMFDSNEAQFPFLSDDALHVSDLIQKANIEVVEEGTIASAVSEAGLQSRTVPSQFVANKPFLFIIVDKQTSIPLFTGAYSIPSVY